MHEHSCNHELKNCEQCDLVYCTKCKKEWKNCYQNHTYYWWPNLNLQTNTSLRPNWGSGVNVYYDEPVTINCMHGE